MKKTTIFAVIILIALGIGGYYLLNQNFFQNKQPQQYAGPVEKIIVGVDFSDILSTPVLIAENQGYFRDEGLDVQIAEYPSGRTALATMVAQNNIDIVTAAQTPVMYNSFSNKNYVIAAGMAYSYEAGSLMLARQDKGIKTAADLNGKKIGTPIGSTGHFFINLFLIYNDLKKSDIEIIDIEANKLPQALAENQVDAIAVWEPQIYNAQKLLGEKAILLPSNNIYRVDFYLISSTNFANNRPHVLVQFLKAVDKAQNFIRQNKATSMDIISSRMHLDKNAVVALWDKYEFKLFLDQPILNDLENEARWAIREGLTDKKEIPNYLNYIYINALEEIKPDAVTIIR